VNLNDDTFQVISPLRQDSNLGSTATVLWDRNLAYISLSSPSSAKVPEVRVYRLLDCGNYQILSRHRPRLQILQSHNNGFKGPTASINGSQAEIHFGMSSGIGSVQNRNKTVLTSRLMTILRDQSSSVISIVDLHRNRVAVMK
jgi:hypothetical protein